MGRLIDVDRAINVAKETCTLHDALIIKNFLEWELTVEAIPKAEYEARLKADLVDILEELKTKIDEKATELCDDGWWLTYNNLIQQKINELKAESEDK